MVIDKEMAKRMESLYLNTGEIGTKGVKRLKKKITASMIIAFMDITS